MTTITTMEELSALDEGRAVLHNGQTWLRRGDSLRRGAYSLPLDAFAGPIAAGRVSTTSPLEAGRWYTREDGLTFYVYNHGEGGDEWRFVASTFSDAMRLDVLRVNVSTWEATERTAPEWATPVVMRLLEQVSNRDAQLHVAEERHERNLAHVARRREVLATNTTTFMHELVEADEDLRDDVVEFCENNGLDAPSPSTEQVEITVEITGEVEVEFDQDDIRRQLSGDVRVPWGTTVSQEVEFEWSYEVTEEVPYGSCACNEVSREDVESMLDNEGIGYSSFDFEVSCEND